MDPVALAALRRYEKPDCMYAVTNVLTDVDHIFRAVSNHFVAFHPFLQSEEGKVATKSTASIPMLEESINAAKWEAWKRRFHQY